ncbi:MAG: hypothetical protein HY769_06910 [Candidatus Stahlbacteria bacterium]|nr:hypothetical protein [Candidatus Stahlbacteria bacterium]
MYKGQMSKFEVQIKSKCQSSKFKSNPKFKVQESKSLRVFSLNSYHLRLTAYFLFSVFCSLSSVLYAEGAKYLIITHDSFYNTILPLAEWKHKKGMETKVVKLSQTGSTETQIKSYIQTAYNTWNPRPEYVLLVGDVEFLPTYWGDGRATDNYYATLEGGDYLSDICMGRFSVDNLSECSTMVAKTLSYERTPWMANDKWFRSAALLIRDDYDSGDSIWYYPDIWFTYNQMVQNGYTNIDTIFHRNGCNAGNIIRSVNDGCGFVGYRGCGTGNWHTPFDVNPEGTDNGWMLPVIFSGTCLTANFEEEGFICELWTLAGSATNPKGAVAFVGTNTAGHSSQRSSIWQGFWRAIFIDSIYMLGNAEIKAKLYFHTDYPDDQYEYEGWHILGDPGLSLWTGTPKELYCSYLHAIPTGQQNFTVSVKSNGSPVKDATVCLSKGTEVYKYGLTNAQGEVTLAINPITADTMWVTVTGHNYLAYEGYCVVISGGAYIHLLNYSIIDTAGNNNGMANPGENIVLPLWVMNYGVVDAVGVKGTLSTTDAYATMIDNYEYFGTIAAMDSGVTDTGYKFLISSNCPDAYKIPFKITITDTANTNWISMFDIMIYSPVITIANKTIDDVGQSIPNGTIDPGETVKLIISLTNSGSAGAYGVSAVLHTDDSYITTTDSTFLYGDILTDSTRNNSSDPYLVVCNSSTPLYHKINFTLRITSISGYAVTVTFNLKVGQGGDFLVWDPDYRHKSGPILDSLLNTNGYMGDYTLDLTDYITGLQKYKSIFICLGVPYYDYMLTEGPDVDSLCNYLDNGGRIYMEGANTWTAGYGYPLQDYFHTEPYSEGYADLDTVVGIPNTFTYGMKFKYAGQNQSIDRIRAAGGSWNILNNSCPSYTSGIAFSDGWHKYKTIASTFEMGNLVDGISSRAVLVDSIMNWFASNPWHDVGIWDIQNPQYFVVWNPIRPRASVKNIGAMTETFNVICQVDSLSHTIYADTVQISNLAAEEEKLVIFDSWTPSTVDNTYNMQFKTLLNGDGESQNNIQNKEVTTFNFTERISSGFTFVPPVIDGYIDTTYEWKNAKRIDISDVLGQAGGVPLPARSAYLYVMNTDSCVYFGVDAKLDKSLDNMDGFFLCFDDNHDKFYPFWPDSSEGWLAFIYHQMGQMAFYCPLNSDTALDNYPVNMEGKSAITAGNLQHEFGLPLGELPEYLNAELGDTVGLGLCVGNLDNWDIYGWWPQQTSNPWDPSEMGELVIALPSGVEITDRMPKVFSLSQNFPNPFLGKSKILYQLPVNSKVSLKIYNTAGQLVRTLVDKTEEAGYKSICWDGKDNTGRKVGSGIYWYRMEATGMSGPAVAGFPLRYNRQTKFTNTKKMIFLAK